MPGTWNQFTSPSSSLVWENNFSSDEYGLTQPDSRITTNYTIAAGTSLTVHYNFGLASPQNWANSAYFAYHGGASSSYTDVTLTIGGITGPSQHISGYSDQSISLSSAQIAYILANITSDIAVVIAVAASGTNFLFQTSSYTATGGFGTNTQSGSIVILSDKRPFAALSASPILISVGASSVLSYNSVYASSAVITANHGASPGSVPLNTTGTASVSPIVNTIYTLTVVSPAGYTATATASVSLPDFSSASIAARVSQSLCNPAIIGASGSTGLSASSLAIDGPGRLCAASAPSAGAVTGYISQDAGHTFLSPQIVSAGSDASLLVDIRQNRFRVVYAFKPVAPATTPPAGLYSAAGYLTDAFPLDAGSPAIIANLSGTFPVAAPHPTDRDYALMAYTDGGALKSAWSMDAGASWNPSSTIASGVNFAASGRPALAFLGDTAAVVYAAGSALLVQTSPDRGMTWGAAVTLTAAGSGPYQSLSLIGWQGRFYLLAFTAPTSPAVPVPALFASGDIGATWAAVSSAFPSGLAPPSALGIVQPTGQVRLGITHNSSDMGATWAAN
jgi:hypothetical protein